MQLKERILAAASMSIRSFNGPLEDLATSIFNYQDILCGIRTASNSSHLRNFVCLHLLNHVLKTRDRVLKNNARAAKVPEGNFDFRDQGFTRPKVLLLLPTRQACVHYVESITKLYQPEQQENMKRFMDQFNRKDDQAWEKKPADFRELFGGNDDDMFRIGLKFTRKSIKFFSQFYNSDVILASPLGLRTIMDKEE
jgi:U3 small nucleolar RNA-associated protein 25